MNWLRRIAYIISIPNSTRGKAAAIVGFFVVVTLVSLVYFYSTSASFTVEARTEVIAGNFESSLAGGPLLTWSFPRGEICAGARASRSGRSDQTKLHNCDLETVLDIAEPFVLTVDAPIDFVLERVGFGELLVALGVINDHRGASAELTFLSSSPRRKTVLPYPIYIRESEEGGFSKPLSLPVLADSVTIGQEANMRGIGAKPMLLSGEVSVYGKALFGSDPYIANAFRLSYGDVVEIPSGHGVTSSLIRLDSKEGLQTVTRFESESISIRSFYGSPRKERMNMLHRITHDPLLAAFWTFAGLLAAWLALFSSQTPKT